MSVESQTRIAQHVALTPLIILVASLIGVVIDIVVPVHLTTHTLSILIAGIAIFLLGQNLIWWSHRNRALMYSKEGARIGTVGSGPYKISRHPRYGGYLLMMIGLGFIMNSLIILLAGFAVFLVLSFFIIPHQERLLRQEFPGVYDEYQKKVPMWL